MSDPQREAQRRQRITQIEEAFSGIPFPGEGHRSLHQAEAWDNYASCDQSKDHKGRWQDIPRQHFYDCQWALPHLDAAGLRYYLPAVMCFALREEDAPEAGGWITESLLYTLQFNATSQSLHDYMRERFIDLSPPQKQAIADFMRFYADDEATATQWEKLAQGDPWPPLQPSET